MISQFLQSTPKFTKFALSLIRNWPIDTKKLKRQFSDDFCAPAPPPPIRKSFATPYPPKDPPEGYNPSCNPHYAFEAPTFLRPAVFRRFSAPDERLGPFASKQCVYKNSEYYAYHRFSFTEMLVGTLAVRQARYEASIAAAAQIADKPESGTVEAKRETQLGKVPSSKPQSKQDSSSKPQSKQDSSSKPQSKQDSSRVMQSKQDSCSVMQSKPDSSSEPESKKDSSSEQQSKKDSSSEPQSKKDCSSEPQSKPDSSSEPQSKKDCSSEPQSKSDSSSEPQSKPDSSSELQSKEDSSCEPNPEPKPTLAGMAIGLLLVLLECVAKV